MPCSPRSRRTGATSSKKPPGLGKFKRRKHRAELKLARVATQVERAKDVEEEVRKRLRPLALQATAAERAEKLAGEIASLRARIAQLDLAAVAERRADAEARRDAVAIARRSAQEKLTALLEERRQAEDELSDAAGGREAALGALYRLQGASERLVVRRESAAGLEDRLREDLAEAERAAADRRDEAVQRLEDAGRAAAAAARDAAEAHGQAAERARLAHSRVAAYERQLSTSAESALAELRQARGGVEAALADATGGQEGANRRLVALGTARERLGLRRNRRRSWSRRSRAISTRPARSLVAEGSHRPSSRRRRTTPRQRHVPLPPSATTSPNGRGRLDERLQALERSLAEREGIPPAASALAVAGETLALSALEAEPGAERAVAAALAWRASAVLARDPRHGLELLERTRRDGLGSLTVVLDREPAPETAPPVEGARPLRSLVAGSSGRSSPARRHLARPGGTAARRDSRNGDQHRGPWLRCRARRALVRGGDRRSGSPRDGRAPSQRSPTRPTSSPAARRALQHAADEAARAAASAEAAFAAVAHLRERNVDPTFVGLLVDIAPGSRRHSVGRNASRRASKSRLRRGSRSAPQQAGELGAELRRLSALEAEAAREAADAVARAQAAEVVVARLGGKIDDLPPDASASREHLQAEAASLLALAEAAASPRRRGIDRARAADAALLERAPRRSALDPDMLVRLLDAVGVLGAGLERAPRPGRPTRGPGPGPRRCRGGAFRRPRRRAAPARCREVAGAAADGRGDGAGDTRSGRARTPRGRGRRGAAAIRRRGLGASRPRATTAPSWRRATERLDARREALGQVNPLAKEEYEAEKERLEELATAAAGSRGVARRDREAP